jgi:hypothetical protein
MIFRPSAPKLIGRAVGTAPGTKAVTQVRPRMTAAGRTGCPPTAGKGIGSKRTPETKLGEAREAYRFASTTRSLRIVRWRPVIALGSM